MAKRITSDAGKRSAGKAAPEQADTLLGRLAANLERLRRQQGFTCESLSARTYVRAAVGQSRAVSEKLIAEIETGKADPKLTTIHAIALALGVKINVLVY